MDFNKEYYYFAYLLLLPFVWTSLRMFLDILGILEYEPLKTTNLK